jgi:RIO-like serine/threonine protein kinase
MITKQQKTVIDTYKKLTNVDLLPYVDEAKSKRSYIALDFSDLGLNNNQLNDSELIITLERIGKDYNLFTIEPNGYNKFALRLMKNNESVSVIAKKFIESESKACKFI